MLVLSLRKSVTLDSDRVELGIHVLSQLPDDVELVIDSPIGARDPAALTARGYGVAERIRADLSGHSSTLRSKTLAELVHEAGGGVAPTRTEGSLSGHRFAIVTNVPTHYRVALFNALTQRSSSVEAQLHVFFLAGTPRTRAWMDPGPVAFEHTFLRSVDLSRDRGRRLVPVDLESRLADFSPTAVLVGGFSPFVAGRAALWARRRHVPFGIWSGELASRPTARSRARTIQRRRLVRRAQFAIAYGSRSATYLRSLDADLPIVIGRNSTIPGEKAKSHDEKVPVRLLATSRAESEKALDVLVEALRRVPDLRCRLSIVGDGPTLPILKGKANGDERIDFLGAVAPQESRRLMCEADVFLFPSRYDIFGLVLVEAMGTGLATVVSSWPGAVDDICVPEHNCVVVKGGAEEWARAISRLVADPDLRFRLGDRARETIRERWTIDHAADAMIAGFRLGALAAAERSVA